MHSPAMKAATSPRSAKQPKRLRGVVVRQLERTTALPVLPAAAAELMGLMGREDTSAKQLSDVIHRDQALAAHVLRVANTPAYRGVAAIVSLQQAVARLGMQLLSEIAVSVSIKGSVFNVKQHAELAEGLWKTAYATGLVAKEIARAQRSNVEAAFLCGLLHDFGAPVVLRTALLAAEAIGTTATAATLVELMGELGSDVGGRLARQWKLPDKVRGAIEGHQRFESAGPHRYEAALTALARAMALHFIEEGSDEEAVVNHPAVVELNLYDDELAALLAKRDAIAEAMDAVCR